MELDRKKMNKSPAKKNVTQQQHFYVSLGRTNKTFPQVCYK